jgi:O-methyltransferase involved in polyketide biosynthesis
MARTDNDSWDITEGVGATALGVAWARTHEAMSECPLFTDQYAQLFIDAALERGWQLPPTHMAERIRAISGYTASRTKWFDEFFVAAGANGIDQAVILAAGLDARAWRLPWVDGSVVYEIDQPKVLEFKTATLRAHDAEPAARYVAVPIDLRQDWPAALRDAGFDPELPTAWAAEGCSPICRPPVRTCCSSAFTSSVPAAAVSGWSPSAPAFSIPTIWPTDANGCANGGNRRVLKPTKKSPTHRICGSSRTARKWTSG